MVLFGGLQGLRDEIVELIAKVYIFLESEQAPKFRQRYKNQANFVGGLKRNARFLEKKLADFIDPTFKYVKLQSQFSKMMTELVCNMEEVSVVVLTF